MRVLIVKTSSLGEVIYTLPAITDARAAIPGIEFDWVVEEDYAEVPAWHPGVAQVIPVALRRWRHQVLHTFGSVEWKQFRSRLRSRHYDLVIDAQGLLKSAWLASLVQAPVAGFDRKSARESWVPLLYRHRYEVSCELPAVERIRTLFARALGYEPPVSEPCYGVVRGRFCGTAEEAANVVLLYGNARHDADYPVTYWRQLASHFTAAGVRVRLPWITDEERERAGLIAAGNHLVEVLPRLKLGGVAGVIGQASAVLGVDSGLGRLSVALEVPTVLCQPRQQGAGCATLHLPGEAGGESLALGAEVLGAEVLKAARSVGPTISGALPPRSVASA